MRLPGFDAESTLYRTSIHYKMTLGGENCSGAAGIPGPPAAPILLPGQFVSAAPIRPFPNVLCQPCILDKSGNCTQYCVHCPDPIPDERCWTSTTSCAPNECCPSKQAPCYVPGKDKFCCLANYQCCNPEKNFCCPQNTSCCNPLCCAVGTDCCFGACVVLNMDPQNCGSCGNICAPGLTCVNGKCVCPILDDPDTCSPGGRTSRSNYYFGNNCQPVTGLTISLTASEDIVSDNGFQLQLNAYSQHGVDSAQQYLFFVQENSIQGVISNWASSSQAIVCDSVNVASTPIKNGIPAGYSLKITLQYQGNSVSGALFEVLSSGLPVATPQTFLVSQAGCHCSDMGQCPPSPPVQFCCTGYQSSADLSPITAFQVNVVGPGGGASATFKSGEGNIQYSVSSGTLIPLSSPPLCVENAFCTAEGSNASYGPLSGCPGQFLTQTFGT